MYYRTIDIRNLKLKFLILERYRTQGDFAIECGRNDFWISRIVNGRQKPTEQDRKSICDKLGVEEEDLFDD